MRAARIGLVLFVLSSLALAAPGCGDEAASPPAERVASAVVDCGRPAGWPSTEEEIRDGFGDDEFLIRQCASDRVEARITCTVPAEDIAGLIAILQNLKENDPDLEVRMRAAHALGFYAPDPANVSIDLDIYVDVPPGTPEQVSIEGSGDNVHRCEVRVYEMLDGAPAEPIYFTVATPASGGICGVGHVGLFEHIACPPGRTLRGEITCFGANLRSATATDDHACGPNATPTGSQTPPPSPPPSTPPPSPTSSATPPTTPSPSATPAWSPWPSPSPTPT